MKDIKSACPNQGYFAVCTVVILLRPGHDWPVLMAANRDEMDVRPARPPARHWLDRPEVVAGLDELAGGTWMGINEFGVVATILNRTGSLGPQQGKRSRGELPLEALEHADADSAAEALIHLNAAAYRPFNMVIADNTNAFWIKADGLTEVTAYPIPAGLHMITAFDLDDGESKRVRHNLEAFANAPAPDPETGQWQSWTELLTHGKGMSFRLPNGFGTVSSSLLALPSVECSAKKPVWLYTHTPPGVSPYTAVL